MVTKSDAEAVCDLFETIGWFGSDTGSYQCLKAYTLGHDLLDRDIKPVFLAEDDLRAAGFAESQWAGGESARAIRKAFAQLDNFLESGELQIQAQADGLLRYRNNATPLLEHFQLPSGTVNEIDQSLDFVMKLSSLGAEAVSQIRRFRPRVWQLDDIRDKLTLFSALRERCESAQQTNHTGVVYAVRFTSGDITKLSMTYKTSMGLEAQYVPLANIVGKVRIPHDVELLRINSGLSPQLRLRLSKGLIPLIKSAASGLADTSFQGPVH